MKKLLIFFILFTNFYLFANNSNLEKVSLQLHWKYQFEFAGFIAAIEKGFYKDAGLDVTLKEYQFGQNIIEEIISNKSNYGIYNSNILVEYLKKQPIELISSYFKRSALVLITKPDIKYPKDLLNKKIMAAGKEDFDLNFNYILSLQEIKTDDLNLIPHSFNIKDFANGKVDAMTAFISDQPYKLDKLNIPYNIIDPSSYGVFNLQLELFTSKEEAQKHRTRTQKFKEASIKGWEYALENQDEIIDIILKKYNTQNLTKDFLENEALHTQRLILPKMYNVGSIDKMFLYRQIDLYRNDEISYKQKENLIDDFIFCSQAELDYKDSKLDINNLKKIAFIILVILLIIIYRHWLLKKYNNKLKNEVLKKTDAYKKANDELKNSNQSFIDLLDTSIEAIALFDENDKLIKLNFAGIDMFKYTIKGNIEKTLIDFIPKETLHTFKNKLHEKKFTPYETELHRLNKKTFPALLSGKLIQKNNKMFTILTVLDLTEIKQKDEFIENQSKLAQMGELLNMIAHQWRQPLTAISAASETIKLKAMLNQLDNQEVQNAADDIYNYTSHLSTTINDFRDFYKNDKVLEENQLNELVEKSLKIIEESISYQNITIIKEYKSESLINNYTNEITHVILSLLQNAQEALIDKKINKPYIKITTFEDNNNLYIDICDNAGGIPKDIFNKIFEPYFSTKNEKNGTGLGLYFAKRIIESNCKGLLKIKNDENGAVFTIVFSKKDHL